MRWESLKGILIFTLAALILFAHPLFSAITTNGCTGPGNPLGGECTYTSDCCAYTQPLRCSPSGVCEYDCRQLGIACTSASQCCQGLECGASGSCAVPQRITILGNAWYSDVYLWVGLSVAIAAAFLGLAYMAAKLLGLQVLDAWVKIELKELAASVLIAFFCIAFIAAVNGAAQFLSGESGATDIVSSAQQFLHEEVYDSGRTIYLRLAEFYFNAARLASYTYTYGTGIPTVISWSSSESPAAGLGPLVGEVGQAMDGVANLMLLAASEASFLEFFRNAATVMLPVGIFLRSFSFTRKIGGVVLAAVISTAVIYPSSFMLAKGVYDVYLPDLQNTASGIAVGEPAGDPPAISVVCSSGMQFFVAGPIPFLGGEEGWSLVVCDVGCLVTGPGYGACVAACRPIVKWGFVAVKAGYPLVVGSNLQRYASDIGNPQKLMDNYYNPLHDYGLPAVAKYGVLSLMVFLATVMIALTMLRGLATAFGGEPQLYGLSKLV